LSVLMVPRANPDPGLTFAFGVPVLMGQRAISLFPDGL
jgi:hypothetical protein